MSSLVIRPERSGDVGAIRAIHLAAFEGPDEADIVDRLRRSGCAQLSLVAERDGELVGHILFSEVVIGDDRAATGMGLAPMAVEPAHQSRGVGSALVSRGLELLREGRFPFVVVLGHPGYYPRFGFVPASGHGVSSEYEGVPDEAFLLLELTPGGLRGVGGVARYRPELGGET